MEIKEDKTYWDQEKEYEKNIISVFRVKNILTEKLENITEKEKKEIIDFGCGPGNAFLFLKKFKKIYGVDFSENMLEEAKKRNPNLKNVEYIRGDLKNTFVKKADVILAVSSIMPKSYLDFDEIMNNLKNNLKSKGKMLLVLPSFESATLFYHLKADYLFNQKKAPQDIQSNLLNTIRKNNYSPMGYFITDINLVQKHWLKEEIKFRLKKLNLKKFSIEKLELDWEKQIRNCEEFKVYERLWFWLVEIEV